VRYSVLRGHTLSTFRTDQPLLRKEWGFFIGRSIAMANSPKEIGDAVLPPPETLYYNIAAGVYAQQ